MAQLLASILLIMPVCTIQFIVDDVYTANGQHLDSTSVQPPLKYGSVHRHNNYHSPTFQSQFKKPYAPYHQQRLDVNQQQGYIYVPDNYGHGSISSPHEVATEDGGSYYSPSLQGNSGYQSGQQIDSNAYSFDKFNGGYSDPHPSNENRHLSINEHSINQHYISAVYPTDQYQTNYGYSGSAHAPKRDYYANQRDNNAGYSGGSGYYSHYTSAEQSGVMDVDTEPTPDSTAETLASQLQNVAKVVSVRSGVFVNGGFLLKGEFSSPFDCMLACKEIAVCLAGQYNQDNGECFGLVADSACASPLRNDSFIFFSKILCKDQVDSMFSLDSVTIQNKKLTHSFPFSYATNFVDCLDVCLNAGNGPAADDSIETIVQDGQICTGISFNFAKHHCDVYFRTRDYDETAKDVCETVHLADMDEVTSFVDAITQPSTGTYTVFVCA